MIGSSVRLGRAAGAMLLFALVVGATQTAASAATGNKASAPGVTATTIKVGLITSYTGPAASESIPGIPKGFAARIDLQNAEGGVNGRKITFVTEDDASNPGTAQTAAAAEVAQGVFAIDDVSALVFGAQQYLTAQGIPVVGGGYDGPEWTDPTIKNMFATQPGVFKNQPRYAVNTTLFKKVGASKFAVVAYSVPSAEAAANSENTSLLQAGYTVPYLNTSLPLGTVNVTAVALQMKAAGVDSLVALMDGNTELSLITAGEQAGIKWKYVDFATGYGQTWLNDAQAVAGSQGDYFGTGPAPVELHTPATIAEQAALKKYAGFTGVPGYDYAQGWTTADLLIKGLEVAGKNPTRASFISNLRKVTNFNAGGLLANTTNFERSTLPYPKLCAYTAQLIGHKFVPTSTKPLCAPLASS